MWCLIESHEPVNAIILFVRKTFSLGRWTTSIVENFPVYIFIFNKKIFIFENIKYLLDF